MIKIILVAGARPNFMKIAPILRAMESCSDMCGVLVHTGQHYDAAMSSSFFSSLGIKKPEYNLEVGSGSHAVQTANVMIKFEEVCLREKPDMVLVVGDVNSTVAAGLVAKKLNIKLVHVEAGLRSGDRTMPEEINRIATDAITDIFFTTEQGANQNLTHEGHSPESIHFVGHVMIDNLFYQLGRLSTASVSPSIIALKNKLPQRYICLTMHRPSNVDHAETFTRLISAIKHLANQCPVLFPCHPRTLKNIQQFGLQDHFYSGVDSPTEMAQGIFLLDPLNYDDFLYLWKDATLVLTDSGGLQEETTALKIPCITMRETTERPITRDIGSNMIAGTDAKKIIEYGELALANKWKKSAVPQWWDGKASERIVEILLRSK